MTGHAETRTLHECAHYPEHEPDRAKDPYYKLFHQTRHQLIDVLGVGCWVGGATKAEVAAGLPATHPCHGCTGLELHHAPLEYAGLAELDWQKVAADFPTVGVHSDEDLLRMAESEGNALILCSVHHRSPVRGIHGISYPVWVLQRYAKTGWDFCETDAAPVAPNSAAATSPPDSAETRR